MTKKKGMAHDDKLKTMQNLMMESKDVWTLKELEKECPKRGIRAMVVKDVLQELCDDDLVSSDKIGIGNYFWCFPSEAYNRRQVQVTKLTNEINDYQQQIEQLTAEIAELEPGREESPERTQLDYEIAEFQKQIDGIKDEASKYDGIDPEKCKLVQRQAMVALDAANRWTDNIFTIKSWATKKFGIPEKDFMKNCGIDENFDYLQ
ncbi:Meiotic nuclear division protein 1 [Tritrichomonas musculus]|uniref:Meiotic nuclear division protein 1 n=1 Tax=Tritrichomonas musculus TaxID=1915356 RepID=A0ABR2KBS3_9EUKA